MFSFIHRELAIVDDQIEHLHHNLDYDDSNWASKKINQTKEYFFEIQKLAAKNNFPVIFTAVPNFDYISYSTELRSFLVPYRRFLNNSGNLSIYKSLKFKDLARDGFHFGELTSKEVANNLYKKYNEEIRKIKE